MNEQLAILISLLLFVAITLYLYIWKAKKEVIYKKDERWQFIQYKSLVIANYSNYFLIVLIAIIITLSLIIHINTTFTITRILIYGLLFIGIRNTIELLALLILDKRY